MSRLRQARAAIFGVLLVIVGINARVTLGQDVPWTFVSPKNQQVIKGPIGSVNVAISKPHGRNGILRVTYERGGQATQLDLEVNESALEFVAIFNGVPMADGTYSLSVSDTLSPDVVEASMSFSIETDPDVPLIGPSIDMPLAGTIFPPNPPSIRFSGISTGRVYFVLVARGTILTTQQIEIPNGSNQWSLDIPWVYDRGDFHALVFTIDPIRFRAKPSDSTWFVVADDEKTVPRLPWAADPRQYER